MTVFLLQCPLHLLSALVLHVTMSKAGQCIPQTIWTCETPVIVRH